MPTKRRKKPELRKSKQNRNVVLYVENCTPKGKVFSDDKSLESFVKKFNKKYPRSVDGYDDNWIDVIITDIKGSISDVDGRLGTKIMGHNLHGDISVEDLALANELLEMENHLDNNLVLYGPSTAARVLVCISHDYYELGDDDKGRELLEKADKICPGYFENKIKDHIDRDPDFKLLVESLAEKILVVARSVIDGQ